MKKSVLWTAAGVITATAIWAGLSLPKPDSISCHKVIKRSTVNASMSFKFHEQPLAFMVKDTESAKLNWDGHTLTVSCYPTTNQPRLVRAFPAATGSLNIDVEKRRSETRPGFSSSSTSRFPITLNVGETIQL
ncbi:hypothetical protein [Armatimonas sp.]|uniref:hypothetical protein n=1 Tax=Armatimonas sp. TaxID=1872638 RepID=UPI00286B556D|nr:hypothetical protein [Armatimonas sp.]